MNNILGTPHSLNRYLWTACLIAAVLYFGKALFIPLSYGLFTAIVLYPLCRWLENKGFPRSLAITVALGCLLLLFCMLVVLLMVEINSFKNELPALTAKMKILVTNIQGWLSVHWKLGLQWQKAWLENMVNSIGANASNIVAGTFTATGNALFTLLISAVFAVLFLYNRASFVLFVETLAGAPNVPAVRVLLARTVTTYYHFIRGMAMVYLIVGILNSIGLLALGIPHAVLFGMLTAIMTIIPYAGIIVSALLPVAVAWISKDSIMYPLGVVAVFTVVQYLEANIIFPRVVGAQLDVSTWATLVAMITGGLLWGVSGMILFIPFTGILKILTDNMPGYKSINILLSR